MRWLALLLLVPTALALTQTLEDMGIEAVAENHCVSWEIPYRLVGDCTPVLYIILSSGEAKILDNGREVLRADERGAYRVLLDGEGTVTIILCPGKEGRGKIDKRSMLTCVRTPLARISIQEKKYKLGYNIVSLKVCNEGTQDLNGRLILRFPPFMAPLSPLKSVEVKAGKCMDVNIPVIVSFTYGPVNMPPICVEYNDPFGISRVCTSVHPTEAEEGGAAICVVSPQIVEIFNPLPFSLRIGETIIEPFSAISGEHIDENTLSFCEKVFYVERREYVPRSDPKDAILVGLILMGFAGIWARWERVKKG